MVVCTFYTRVCKLHLAECGGHLAECGRHLAECGGHLNKCGGHSRVANFHSRDARLKQEVSFKGRTLTYLSVIRPLLEIANQKKENGNGVDEHGNAGGNTQNT